MVRCQPPPKPSAAPPARPACFSRWSSSGMCRSSARISPQVSSAVAEPVPPVPHTVTPRPAAAAISMAALPMPVVTSSRSRGSWPSVAASNGVRSRIATTTSYGSRALTSASVREMCSANTSIWPSERTADQSALARETC
jgi:hypothetical protein